MGRVNVCPKFPPMVARPGAHEREIALNFSLASAVHFCMWSPPQERRERKRREKERSS